MTSDLRLLDHFHDMRTKPGASLDKFYMDGDELLDDDGNLFNVVLAKSVANGLEFEVK